MAIVQISRVQNRRGLQQDLPQLASAELGWSVDTQRLYIGNGTTQEGAPSIGVTEILTQHSIINFTQGFASNVVALQNNVAVIQSQISYLSPTTVTLSASSSGTLTSFGNTNAIVQYTLLQGSVQRTGRLNINRNSSTVNYDEDYTQTGSTDIVFSVNANTTQANLNYTTTTAATVKYTITSY